MYIFIVHVVLLGQELTNVWGINCRIIINNFNRCNDGNQYKYSTSQRHSMINHCDRCITLLGITLLGDTDISFAVFNLFTYFDMPFGW